MPIENTPIEITLDEIQEELLEKFGNDIKFTSIKLYRISPEGINYFLKNFSVIPDLETVKKLFGGGKFEIWVQWRDNTNKRRFDKYKFDIEGKPVYAGDPVNEVKPAENPDAVFMKNIAMLKGLGLINPAGNNNKSSDTALILESMKANNSMMLEMIKSVGNKSNDKLLEVVLNSALAKSNELDQFEKFSRIMKVTNGKNGGGDLDWLKDLAPAAMAMFAAGKNKQSGTNGTANNNAFNIALVNELKALKAKLAELEKDVYIDAEEETAKEPEQIENNNLETIKKDDPQMLKIAEQLLNLDDIEKVKYLEMYIGLFGVEKVKQFCLNYEVVKTEEEFLKYLKQTKFYEVLESINNEKNNLDTSEPT